MSLIFKNVNFLSYAAMVFALSTYGGHASSDNAYRDGVDSSETQEYGQQPDVTPQSTMSTMSTMGTQDTKKTGNQVQKGCTIGEALTQAYRHNPEIKEALRQYYARVEDIPTAKSGWLPNLSLQGSAQHEKTDRTANSGLQWSRLRTGTDTMSASASMEQNIFNGFRTTNEIIQAEATVEAAKFQYYNVEQETLFKAVQAYLRLWRAYETLKFRNASEAFLLRTLQQVQAQERVGEKTRTEVAEAQSRHAQSISERLTAEAGVVAAEATYRQVIGTDQMPDIQFIPKCIVNEADLPKTLEEYARISKSANPILKNAEFSQNAAKANIEVRNAARRPSVDLNLEGARTKVNNEGIGGGNATDSSFTTQATVGARLTIPLYQGGREWSALRRAKQEYYQSRSAVQRQYLSVLQAVEANWKAVQANRDSIEQSKVQVQAAELTLEGRRQEFQVGEKTLTDVLDAQQALVNAQVRLVEIQQTFIESQYQMLSLMGRLLPETLGLDVQRNDVTQYRAEMSRAYVGEGNLRIPDSVKED